jgi:hypothetical protein
LEVCSALVEASSPVVIAPDVEGWCFVVRLLCVDVHPSALKHGVSPEDIERAVRNAMATDDLDDDMRLYLGPSGSGSLLEVIVIVRRKKGPELVIHAMPMREKYRRLLPGG